MMVDRTVPNKDQQGRPSTLLTRCVRLSNLSTDQCWSKQGSMGVRSRRFLPGLVRATDVPPLPRFGVAIASCPRATGTSARRTLRRSVTVRTEPAVPRGRELATSSDSKNNCSGIERRRAIVSYEGRVGDEPPGRERTYVRARRTRNSRATRTREVRTRGRKIQSISRSTISFSSVSVSVSSSNFLSRSPVSS